MPQSLARNAVHLVFSTKLREPFLGPDVRPAVFAYLAGAFQSIGCHAIAVGGVADHVHVLFLLARTVPLCKAVEEVKKESSKWAKGHVHPDFYWQAGYGAFAVSRSNEDRVVAYIEDQERHHTERSFQDEFRGLLRAHGVEWDEQYVWE